MTDRSLLCTEKYRSPKPLPFGAKMMTAMQKYNIELDNNVRVLCMKYPNEPSMKIKELLEELQNSVEMVQDVLHEQGSRPIVESKVKEVIPEKQKYPCDDPEKKMLKRALASLFKKYEKVKTENAMIMEENRKLKNEVTFYKARSSLLVQEQLNNKFDKNLHIY